MKKKKSAKVSLGDIAKAAGVSKATACYVLRNQPGPSQGTREHVLEIARRLGYAPDARMASWMAAVRDAKSKDLLPIAWLNTTDEKEGWTKYKFHSPYLEGARERAGQLGYRIEELWTAQPDMTMRRISQVLYQRGIEGAIVTHPARHVRLNWDRLAAVALEGALLAPRLHRVMTDTFFNLLLALKMVKRSGYRRVGICIEQRVDRQSYHAVRAAAHYFHVTTPPSDQVAPLFYQWREGAPGSIQRAKQLVIDWMRQQKPDVIVGHNNCLREWIEEAGFRVPEEMGVIHIATDDDVSDWAGINSRRREIGATAAERVISLLQNRQFGVPRAAVNMAIRGAWSPGSTLLIPKPK